MAKFTKFKAGNGKYYTRQIFQEQWSDLTIAERALPEAPFCLHKDMPGKINFGREYINLRDPTGYKVSQLYLGSFNHFTTLMSCRWFVAAKEIWDREMDARIKGEALDEIRSLMENGMPAQRLAAAKYLANGDYKKKEHGRGRPKREDIDRAARDMAVNEKDIEEDLKRISAVS